MTYAARTQIPVQQTKSDIEHLVRRRGADAFAVMERGNRVQVAFAIGGRNVLFKMDTPEGEQERMSIWRALLLTIKGKLESADRGIESFEEAFLSNIVMPNGDTVGEATIPRIADHYRGNTDVPLLPSK